MPLTKIEIDAKTKELETMAAEIGKVGAEDDDAIKALVKGVQDGFNRILDLFKAKGKASEEEEDDEDTGDSEEEDDKGPGYEDMQMGQRGTVIPSEQAEMVDGTQFMLDAVAFMRQADANVRELSKAVKALRAENSAILEAVAQAALANAETTVPLAKAVVDVRARLLSVPAASPTPRDRLTPVATLSDKALIGGSELSEKRALAKAINAGIIDSRHMALFHQSRRFAPDDAQATDLRKRIEALAS